MWVHIAGTRGLRAWRRKGNTVAVEITITVPDDLAEAVRAHVTSGAFRSEADVFSAALRALSARLAAKTEMDGMLREMIAEAEADPRPSVPIDQALARVRAALSAIADEAADEAL